MEKVSSRLNFLRCCHNKLCDLYHRSGTSDCQFFTMNRENRIQLYANVSFMIENVTVDDVVHYAIAESLITNEAMEEILNQPTRSHKVRKLLKSLPYDQSDCFSKFIVVLRSSSHEFVAEQLLNTDASQYPQLPDDILPLPLDVPMDNRLQDMQKQMADMMQMLSQFVKVAKCEPDVKETRVIDQVDGVIRETGVTDDVTVTYYRDILGAEFRKVQPNSESDTLGDSGENTEFSLHVSESRHIARLIGTDIVKYIIRESGAIPRVLLEPARCMRINVDKIISTNYDIFQRMITDVLQTLPASDVFVTLKTIGDKVIGDKVNWGRIVTIYAFAAWVAVYFNNNGNSKLAYTVGEFIGYYVSEELGSWIDHNGGWVS